MLFGCNEKCSFDANVKNARYRLHTPAIIVDKSINNIRIMFDASSKDMEVEFLYFLLQI